jgi:hypothetical protein
MRYEYPSLRQGLVGAWCPSLGASGLSLIDRSGLGNHGSLTNMGGQVNWPTSGSGVAVQCDGVNDYITAVGSTDAQMLSMWFRLTSPLTLSNFPTLFGASNEQGGSYRMTMCAGFNIIGQGTSLGTGRLCVISYDGTNLSGAYSLTNFSSLNGTWFHVACGWDGSRWCVFVKGIDETNAQNTQQRFSNLPKNSSYIGAYGPSIGRYCPAQFDDVRIYNRALTPAEISLLASRRGIGLTPLPDRGGGLPRKMSVNVGGTWRAADAYVRTATDWRLSQASVNVGGVWK